MDTWKESLLSEACAVLHWINMLHILIFPEKNTWVRIERRLFNLLPTLITRISEELWMTKYAKIQWRISKVDRGTKKISWATLPAPSAAPAFSSLPAPSAAPAFSSLPAPTTPLAYSFCLPNVPIHYRCPMHSPCPVTSPFPLPFICIVLQFIKYIPCFYVF